MKNGRQDGQSRCDDAPPDPKQLAPLRVEVIPNAVLHPPALNRGLPGGVFREDGSFCQYSRTVQLRHRLTRVPRTPPGPVDHRPGRYLYAGQTRGHFGHFIMEGMTRFWAVGRDLGDFDGVLFFPLPGRNIQGRLNGAFRDLLQPLVPAAPCLAVPEPLRVDELVVPSQGFGFPNWTEGHAEVRDFMRSRYAAAFRPKGPEKLYVSRSRVRSASGDFDKENQVEQLMQQAGYEVFHPQEHSIAEQAGRFLAARQIVGGDGSAFHFGAMLVQPQAQVGIIHRRHDAEVIQALAHHVRSWSGADVHELFALRPQAEDTPAELDMAALQVLLGDKEFL